MTTYMNFAATDCKGKLVNFKYDPVRDCINECEENMYLVEASKIWKDNEAILCEATIKNPDQPLKTGEAFKVAIGKVDKKLVTTLIVVNESLQSIIEIRVCRDASEVEESIYKNT